MSIYKDFAYYYDLFMNDIPYDKWTEYIHSLLKEEGIKEGIICELGCGTGEVTRRLRKLGYDMIGIDLSEDMLMQARDKMYDDDCYDIIYTKQDMRYFELYGTVAAFVCVCDSINYIQSYEELVQVFKNVNNYLDKDGLFIMDMKTEYLYKEKLGDNYFKQDSPEAELIWENHYKADTKENVYDIIINAYNDDDSYDELKEHHVQHCYSTTEITRAMEEAGLKLKAVYNAFTKDAPNDMSERVYFIANEGFQEGKTYL